MVELVSYAGRAGVSLLADWIRTRPPSAAQSPPGPPSVDDGCPMCRVHADLAEAQMLLAAMVVKAEPDGGVPDHFAATVLLVDQHLRLASERLDRVAEEKPELADQAQVLKGKVLEARGNLPARDDVTRVTAQAAATAVEARWRDSVDLADRYFAPPGDTPGPRLRALVTSLTPEERATLAQVLAEGGGPTAP